MNFTTLSNQELIELNDELLYYFDGSDECYFDITNDYITYEQQCSKIDDVADEMARRGFGRLKRVLQKLGVPRGTPINFILL